MAAKKKQKLKVVVDPRIYEEIGDDKEMLAAVEGMIAKFREAASTCDAGDEEAFNKAMTKLTGHAPQPITEEDYEALPDRVKKRLGEEPPSRH